MRHDRRKILMVHNRIHLHTTNRMTETLKSLRLLDVLVISFLLFLSTMIAIFFGRIDHAALLIGCNAFAIVGILYLTHIEWKGITFVRIIRSFYMVPGIPLVFKEMHFLVQPIHPVDYDSVLISIDHWLFGVHPTQWLSNFSGPVLTEILMIAYSSFYFLLIIIGIDLYRRRDKSAFEYGLLAIVYGFFLSYIGYMLVPAVGPRFTLHDFHAINTELPGVWITEILRSLLNLGESIPDGTPNPMLLVQRDVFPSGHTQMTLIMMYVAKRFSASTRWFIWSVGTLLIIGTVYLRYHYVIDLIGGAVFMILTLKTLPSLQKAWGKIQSGVSG